MGHGLQPQPRRGQRIHLRDPRLLQVRRRAQLQFLGFVQECGHDVWPLRAQLQALEPVRGAPAHPLARRFRRVRRALPPTRPGPLVVDEARGDDFVAVAAFTLADRQRVIG